jgi:hypothetical protein
MRVPAVKGYGDLETESFDDYYDRWPTELSNFPKCVVENWVYRHWQDFKNLWLDRSIEDFVFELAEFNNAQISEVRHIGDWLETMDYWGDELFRNKLRQSTWLAKYMLANGTTPAPIIIAPNASGLEHPKGGSMQDLQLIEGHMRLSYLRGMIRHNHSGLKALHVVWRLDLPNNSFKGDALKRAP